MTVELGFVPTSTFLLQCTKLPTKTIFALSKKGMKEATCELRKLSQQLTDDEGDYFYGLVDVGVSCDGSWA